jgi:hypothetical protein
LFVDCDDTFPVMYREFVTAAPCAYAVGLVLSVGPGVRLQFESSASAAATEWPIGPLFLEWWRTAASSFEVVAEGQQFKWERFVEP